MIFDRLSIPGRARPEQLLKLEADREPRAWRSFLGQDCALCAGLTEDRLICAACEAGLPTMGVACSQCAIPLASAGLCGQCRRRPPPFDAALCAFEYRFPIDRLIQRFKYHGDLALGRWLAERLCDRVMHCPRPDLLVGVPMTASRLGERGFNQAVQIARIAATRLRVPIAVRGVRKLRETPAQRGLTARSRRANLRSVFVCEERLDGRNVAVVDDVVTTGATVSAVADALRSSGASRVEVWTLARTP